MEAAATISATKATLPYADLAGRWGVSVEYSTDRVRVVVPPVPSWRHLGKGFHIGIAVLAAINVAWWVGAAVGRRVPLEVLVWNCAIYGVPLLILLLIAAGRLRRRTVIEVSAAEVSVCSVGPRGDIRRRSWSRPLVSEIKLNRMNGKLLIRVAGNDLVEVYLAPNRELNAAVADVVAAALNDVPAMRLIPPADLPGPAPHGSETTLRRPLLVIASAVLFVTAVCLMFLPSPPGSSGCTC